MSQQWFANSLKAEIFSIEAVGQWFSLHTSFSRGFGLDISTFCGCAEGFAVGHTESIVTVSVDNT